MLWWDDTYSVDDLEFVHRVENSWCLGLRFILRLIISKDNFSNFRLRGRSHWHWRILYHPIHRDWLDGIMDLERWRNPWNRSIYFTISSAISRSPDLMSMDVMHVILAWGPLCISHGQTSISVWWRARDLGSPAWVYFIGAWYCEKEKPVDSHTKLWSDANAKCYLAENLILEEQLRIICVVWIKYWNKNQTFSNSCE